MTGSLQVKKGIYYAVLNTYLLEGGKKKRKQTYISTDIPEKGNNKRKAEKKLRDILAEYEGKEVFDPVERDYSELQPITARTNPLFTDYMRYWLREKKASIELNTWESYETYVNKHVIPYFEKQGLKIREVTPKHIKDYYSYKLSKGRSDKKGGLSVSSVKKHASVMNQALNEALIEEIIDRNPMDKVMIPKQDKPKKEIVFLTADEANELLQIFRGHPLQPVLLVTLNYGLRRSEVAGLKWDAVDFKNNTISIQHTVVQNKTRLAKDKTKTFASRRTYELLSDVKELLLDLKEKQKRDQNMLGSDYSDSGYIFVQPDGEPMKPEYLWRAFKREIRKYHFKEEMRFHDLRHSTASILYDKGWPLKDIQEWLGHADIGVTGNIYTHITQQRKKALAQGMENTLRI